MVKMLKNMKHDEIRWEKEKKLWINCETVKKCLKRWKTVKIGENCEQQWKKVKDSEKRWTTLKNSFFF